MDWLFNDENGGVEELLLLFLSFFSEKNILLQIRYKIPLDLCINKRN